MSGQNRTDEILLLTFQEILLLLQSLGYTEVRGIRLESKKADKEGVIRLIGGLVDKGLLIPEEETFRIEEKLGRMMVCMGEPEQDYELEYDGELFYCYEREEDALVTSLYQRRPEMLELRFFTEGGLKKWKEEMRDDTRGY